jgi:hypothetical protein
VILGGVAMGSSMVERVMMINSGILDIGTVNASYMLLTSRLHLGYREVPGIHAIFLTQYAIDK